MAFTVLAPIPRGGTAKSGIRSSAEIDAATGKETVRLSLNAKAQDELFEGPVTGQRFDLEVGRGSDHGRLRIRLNEHGKFTPRTMMRGAVLFSIQAWPGLPEGSHKPADCEAEDVLDGIVLRLPEWAQPEAAKAAMEDKFGLKKAGNEGSKG